MIVPEAKRAANAALLFVFQLDIDTVSDSNGFMISFSFRFLFMLGFAFTEQGDNPIADRDELHKNKEDRHPERIEVLEKKDRILRILICNDDSGSPNNGDQRPIHLLQVKQLGKTSYTYVDEKGAMEKHGTAP